MSKEKNMDFQKYFDQATKKMRDDRFKESSQLTLGELIALLKNIPTEYGDDKQPVTVEFDFGTAYPIGLDSWRGAYRELAINYALSGYDTQEQFAHTDLKDFVEWLTKANGETYTGWKGGDFTMNLDTPLWVANSGNVGNTGIVGIRNEDYTVILLTAYCEY
jgi:hypothetical protein